MTGVRVVWRRRLGVLSVTWFGPSPRHVAAPVAMVHLAMRRG